ncbi:MAG TPA: hypothetical protein VES66_11175 [Terriglobales bacterium]|nr:hypothetical protein [Terriglobales bacterium]
MIFGFNTAVRLGDTVYHVQSEPRERERLLETQVFVGGRCIGKRATSYDEIFFQPGSIEDQLHDLLRSQHRLVVEAAREGRLGEVLGGPGAQPELSVHFLNADSVFADDVVVMRFRVTAGGQAVPGASLTSRVRVLEAEPIYSQAITDAAGTAEMRVALREAALQDADILVEAIHGGRSAVRKFRLRKSG